MVRSDGAVRLVRRNTAASRPRAWGDEVRALLDDDAHAPRMQPGWRPWQVLGGPGTGKTALLVDVAAARIAAGADPASVLVLAHSKQAAGALRDAIGARLAGPDADAEGGVPGAIREPMVRTVHSYAFAILRRHALAHGNPPPRLLTGAEQDAAVREMLRGDLVDMAAGAYGLWPERLRPALALGGFAQQLRDLMSRATERGIGPEDLVRLGHEHDKPEWVAVGRFAIRYEQTMVLRWSVGVETPEATAPALGAAELIGASLDALAADPNLLAAERSRIGYLLVDDAQHLDPQAATLVEVIGRGAGSTVIAGDPDQAVFAFRGADARFVADLDVRAEQRIVLRDNHRISGQVHAAAARVAARLPGRAPQRLSIPDHPDSAAGAEMRVRVLATPAKEAALIADHLRRAHFSAGVPWSHMAVIVRSVPLTSPTLRRALHAAGVPVHQPVADIPLARRRGASWLLLSLRAVLARAATRRGGQPEFEPQHALDLLAGPLGGADQIAVRRLRRGLKRAVLESARSEAGSDDPSQRGSTIDDRSSARVLSDLVIGSGNPAILDRLTEVEAAPLRRVLDTVERARAAHEHNAGLEDVLWVLWTTSRLERRWVAHSERGGPVGVQADRDLNAVVGLFDAAAAYVDRLPRASIEGFVDYLVQQEIPHDAVPPAAPTEAVALLSAHSAAGREWDVVAVAAVQEGIWPNPRPRGTLLHTEDLVDLASGVSGAGEEVSRVAPILAEERRLLFVACSRARRSLLVTAVESAAGERDLVPSRFLTELLGHEAASEGDALPVVDPGRALVMHSLVAELRGVVCDPAADPQRQRRAAHQLARLAHAGVGGTHPDEWYGAAETSSDQPLWAGDDSAVTVSPSTIDQLRTCPLRWALERHGGADGDNPHAIKGNLVHTLVQALAGNVPEARVRAALHRAWRAVEPGTGWHSRQELRRTEAMLETFSTWVRNTRDELTRAGVEVPFDRVLPARVDTEPAVRIRGRIDRLERDLHGRFVIIDVKTGKTPITKQAAVDHAQLATYQVAAAVGALDPTAAGDPAADPDTVPTDEPGGARLVYVAKPSRSDGATQRAQPPLDVEALARWRDTIHQAAGATRGPSYLAMRNDGCRHCPVAGSCPVQTAGRQVTDE